MLFVYDLPVIYSFFNVDRFLLLSAAAVLRLFTYVIAFVYTYVYVHAVLHTHCLIYLLFA